MMNLNTSFVINDYQKESLLQSFADGEPSAMVENQGIKRGSKELIDSTQQSVRL